MGLIFCCRPFSAFQDNASHHRRQKAERGTSGAFCRPSAFALLADF